MPPSPVEDRDLRSWKEIAAYPDITVRTAQRYERELGLPHMAMRAAGMLDHDFKLSELDVLRNVRVLRSGTTVAEASAAR